MKTPAFLLLLILSLPTLSGQSWIRQNPFPQLAVMQDLDFEGLNGIAVGNESAIFTTTNGGVNWVPRKAPQEGSLYQAALVVPGTSGQLMLAGGYDLIISHDGGQSWDRINTGFLTVYKIQSLPNGTILVLNSDYGLKSADLGETWETFNMPGSSTAAGHFTSEMHGWVQYGGFDNNQVWVTTDGGGSWAVRDTLKHPVIAGIEMLNDQVGFLGSRDFVYKTIDGGNSWFKMHNDPVYSIQDIHVINENEIWTCQINGFIFYTLDGGGAWTNTNPNIISSNSTTGIYANDAGKVWVTGKFVSIMYSPNQGQDWTDQIPNAKGIMYRPDFFDENTGVVGSSEGTLLKTVNGGASWEKIQFGPDENFFAVDMVSEQAMVIGSSSGKVYGSMDQGENWTMIGDQLGQVSDLHVLSLQSAVLTAESGKIYKTKNGGAQWDEVYSGNQDILFGLDFKGQQRGWACGWYGQILHTEDGGDTWVSQHYDGRNQFVDIHFTSPDEGWVVSSTFTDTVWHTTNGGTDWQTSILPYKVFWHGVSFTNQDTGWIAGGSAGFGIVLRTNNGGQTWSIDHQSPEALLGIYAVPQKETVWATGVGGNIVKYSPCTFIPQLSNLTGDLMPCQGDTVPYLVNSSDVDLFEWSYPTDWLVYGNSNTSSIQFIIGMEQGEISVTGRDACGNSASELNINVAPIAVPEAIISENNGVLSCNLTSGFYQWLLDGIPVQGATEQTYTPVSNGQYAVVVTLFTTGCVTRSNAYTFVINSIDLAGKNLLHVYPNPVAETLFFSTGKAENDPTECIASVTNLEGKSLFKSRINTNSLDISGLPNGLYVLLIKTENSTYQNVFTIHRN